MGKDDFLKMFVTQLKYQDPLNPIKNEDFAAQLAQFTQLEELQNMNTSLQQSIQTNVNMSQGINNSLATTMIGKSVKTSDTEFAYETGDGNKDLNFTLGKEAQKVTIKIYNENGDLVKTIDQYNMAAGENKITWNGTNDSNSAVQDGNYTFTIKAEDISGKVVEATPYQLLKITGIKFVDGLANLMSGDIVISYSDVLEIMESGS